MSTHIQMRNFHLLRMNHGEVEVLSFIGRLGDDEYGRVDKELAQLLEQKHRRVILDLALLSSAATLSVARLLVRGLEFCRHGGELKLVGLSAPLKHSAEIGGV